MNQPQTSAAMLRNVLRRLEDFASGVTGNAEGKLWAWCCREPYVSGEPERHADNCWIATLIAEIRQGHVAPPIGYDD